MDFEAERKRLVRFLSERIADERVLKAMSRVPREVFVSPSVRECAYDDRPLPIGMGQTISQPYIVALMTQALELQGTERVLEVGTGSGYQAAILAELAAHVDTVERFAQLADGARATLEALGYRNVDVHLAEAVLGWMAGAPYDAIMVTAGAPDIPADLVLQLETGGRLVVPVGSKFDQDLMVVVSMEHGLQRRNLGGCRFVPLVGAGAWPEG